MATLQQQPPELNIAGCAGSPFTFTLNITPKDDDGNVISWDDFVVTELAAIIYANHAPAPDTVLPQVTTPTDGEFVVSWTDEATQALFGGYYRWALQAKVNGAGPFSLMAGALRMIDPTETGQSVGSISINGVPLDDDTVDLAVTLGGGQSPLSIPTADPHIVGHVWNNAGVLMVSAG